MDRRNCIEVEVNDFLKGEGGWLLLNLHEVVFVANNTKIRLNYCGVLAFFPAYRQPDVKGS